MSEVQFVGGAMNDTVTVLESISKIININLFYSFNLWEGEIKLQGHYKSESVTMLNKGLKQGAEIEVSWTVDNQGYAVTTFMYNEREVQITLT